MEWRNNFLRETDEQDDNLGKRDGFIGETMVVLPVEQFRGFSENPLVRRLYLTDVGYFPKAAKHYRNRPSGTEEYIFFFCIAGSGTIWVENRRFRLHANEAFCIPRGKPHRYFADEKEPWSILWVHLKGEDTQYYPLDECMIVHFPADYAANRMMFLFELLFRVLDRSYTLGNFIYISNVLSLILAETYMREKPTDHSDSQNRYLTDILKYMSTNLREDITLQLLSERFDISKSYINELFMKCLGRSPIDFLIRLRMHTACKLLKTTDKRIYEIAEAVGYKDQYYFSRIFRKIIGMSPRKYREEPVVFSDTGGI